MSRQMRERAMLTRVSQRMRGGGSFPALAGTLLKSRNWPSIPSPRYKPIAWRDAEHDARHWNVRFTRSPLLQPEEWQAAGYGSTAVWLDRHPYIGALQTGISIERQFSRIFPAHPRSLASVLIPRPAARRGSASHSVRPCGFRLSKNLCATTAKRFSEPSEKAPLGLGSGAHSRRFAQECPEGNPGKYQTGEMTCSSMKTKSS